MVGVTLQVVQNDIAHNVVAVPGVLRLAANIAVIGIFGA
jgi:hypothetical protein